MTIKEAANFASKMNKEGQHTFYQCCRIAADYYKVSATDVQKELASRSGAKANGRKYKHVVVYRIPDKLEEMSYLEWYEYTKDLYFSEVKTTLNPSKIFKRSDAQMKVFDNKKDAERFSKQNIDTIKRNIVIIEKATDTNGKPKEVTKNISGDLKHLIDFFSEGDTND